MQIINRDGSIIPLDEWQEIYNLPAGTNMIGRFYGIGEHAIYNNSTVAAPLILLLDKFRELKGRAVNINSLYRTEEHQQQLKELGYRAASVSPHVQGMAADVDTISEQDTYDTVSLLKKAAKQLGFKIRLGYRTYLSDGNTFVHVDVCPEYYAQGKPYYGDEHPKQWENSIVW
jgi:uncharacterized protein (UPF0210 family)